MTPLPDARPATCSLAMMASAAREVSPAAVAGRARQFELAASTLVDEFGTAFSVDYVERTLGECVAQAVALTDDPDMVSFISFRVARERLHQAERTRSAMLDVAA
jgi:hypothetical protein